VSAEDTFCRNTVLTNRPHIASAQDSIHFKARVLDLVEAFMKRQPQNALLLPLIPILLRLNQEIGTKDKQLGSKAGAVLQSRVVSHKEVPVIETKDVEVAGAALEAIHEIARGAASKEFLALCSHCSVFVSKALAHANMPSSSSKTGAPVEVVARTYAASLKEVMTKKNSRLHTSFISDLVQRQPEQAWSLRDDIVKYANGEGVNDHQQADAFNLMSAMAKRLTVISQTNDVAQVKAWIMSARKVLYDVLEKESSDSGTWQAPRIKDVIKTALQIARFSKPVLADEFAAAWGGDAAAALGEKLSQTKRLQNNASVRMLYGQFELFVSPSAQAAQLKRKEEKKKRRRNDGETTKGDVVAMDVDDKVDEVTPKKKGKGGKSTKTKGETVAEGAKKTKKRKVVA
jgi:DNA polymerase phi